MGAATVNRKTESDVDDVPGVPLDIAKRTLGDLVVRAAVADERIPITRYGKAAAYVIGPTDFERLTALGDKKSSKR